MYSISILLSTSDMIVFYDHLVIVPDKGRHMPPWSSLWEFLLIVLLVPTIISYRSMVSRHARLYRRSNISYTVYLANMYSQYICLTVRISWANIDSLTSHCPLLPISRKQGTRSWCTRYADWMISLYEAQQACDSIYQSVYTNRWANYHLLHTLQCIVND